MADWRPLAGALALAAVILAAQRSQYWRPFDDTAEESTVSCHAYGFAAASVARLWPNPIVARHVDVERSEAPAHPHWPNGWFLLLEAVLRLFGRTEVVGRSFAIAGTHEKPVFRQAIPAAINTRLPAAIGNKSVRTNVGRPLRRLSGRAGLRPGPCAAIFPKRFSANAGLL